MHVSRGAQAVINRLALVWSGEEELMPPGSQRHTGQVPAAGSGVGREATREALNPPACAQRVLGLPLKHRAHPVAAFTWMCEQQAPAASLGYLRPTSLTRRKATGPRGVRPGSTAGPSEPPHAPSLGGSAGGPVGQMRGLSGYFTCSECVQFKTPIAWVAGSFLLARHWPGARLRGLFWYDDPPSSPWSRPRATCRAPLSPPLALLQGAALRWAQGCLAAMAVLGYPVPLPPAASVRREAPG